MVKKTPARHCYNTPTWTVLSSGKTNLDMPTQVSYHLFMVLSNLTTLFPFLAVIGSVTLFWGQIKDFLTKIIRLLIVEAQIHGAVSNATLYYLKAHGKRVPTNVMKYLSTWEFIKRGKEGGVKMVVFEGGRDLKNQWFWFNGSLITISDLHGLNKETGVSYESAITLHFLRGTIDIENLLKDAAEWYEDKDKLDALKQAPRFRVERFVGKNATGHPPQGGYAGKSLDNNPPAHEDWKYTKLLNYSIEDIGYSKKNFFHVFNESTQRIKNDVENWLNAKEWYESKGILFRRGCLMFGAPGSGKSSLIRKIGQSLDLPVLAFELATMNDQQFIEFWNVSKQSAPCIVVMEDIDTSFSLRKGANEHIKLSFECLLNCISGVEPAEGIYLFVTTNKLDQLDEALGVPNEKGISTRPGRLDTCFHIGDITLDEKRQIVKHFLPERPSLGELLITDSNGCTAAQFSDLCSQKALELYWEGKK